jgi:hypothetical protein
MEKHYVFLFFLTTIGFVSVIVISSLSLSTTKRLESCDENLYKAKRLKGDFEQIKSDLFSGNKLRFIIDYEKMNLYMNGTLQAKSPNAVGGFEIDIFEYFGPFVANNPIPYIAASSNAMIIHSRYGVIYNYGKLRIYENNRFEVGVVYIDVKSTNIVFQETFNATLPNEAVGIYLN